MSKAIYPSKYTNRKVTDAQYLTDFIMERIALKEKESLPYRYWNLPRWNKIFIRQLGEANALLKEVNCAVIMEFLRSYKGRNIYSLGLKKLILLGCKTPFHKHPNGINTSWACEIEMGEMGIYANIEEIPEEELLEIDEVKPNLWEKLN